MVDRLVRLVVGLVLWLVLLAFGLRLLGELLSHGLAVPTGTGTGPGGGSLPTGLTAFLVVLFLIGVGVRLRRGMNQQAQQRRRDDAAGERRAPRRAAADVAPWRAGRGTGRRQMGDG
jgi:hypothetical protein